MHHFKCNTYMLYKQKQNGATFTWHVAKAKVSDAVIIVEEDVERVQSPRGLHQQTRPQRHHKPRSEILAKNCHNQSSVWLPFLHFPSFSKIFLWIVLCIRLLLKLTSTPRPAARPPWSAASSG